MTIGICSELMYRILSPTAILGYGFPEESLKKSLECDLDLIAVDAGSMDAGPYYLGANAQYVGQSALKRDLRLIVNAAIEKKCPLVIGSAGFSGGDVQLRNTVEIVREIIGASGRGDLTLAVIPSSVPNHLLRGEIGSLTPLGDMPPITAEQADQSEIVGQMGIEPIIAALDNGAQIIVCGRAYDPAVFSADAIRKGYPQGVCLHAAKILECGAIACEPGSGSDCLIAEISRDGTATFYSPNEQRVATIGSIAAHTLYEKSRPDIFYLPGGALGIQNTRFHRVDSRKASLSGSEFKASAYSIKLEGSRCIGKRIVSILPVKSQIELDSSIRVYGRNGVECKAVDASVREMGFVVIARCANGGIAKDTLAFLRSTMLHYGYKGRVSTAGNLAFPFSPSDMVFEDGTGETAVFFVAGSRDPVFQDQFDVIKSSITDSLKEQHPDLYASTSIEFIVADARNPLAILETIGETTSGALAEHRRKELALVDSIDGSRTAFLGVDAGDAYVWSVHHLLHDKSIIAKLFPIEISSFSKGRWSETMTFFAEYRGNDVLDEESFFNQKLNVIKDSVLDEPRLDVRKSLLEVAKVIRSKNAGINEITFDILFHTESEYETAIGSGIFGPSSMATILEVVRRDILGCFRFDPARAIKVTLRRKLLCGDPGERDVFGAQQHSRLLSIRI